MKSLIDAYLQVEFLDGFYSALSETNVSDMLLKGGSVSRIERVYNFINKNAILHFDCEHELFSERVQGSVYYKHLLKVSQTGGSKLDFVPSIFADGIDKSICPNTNARTFFMLNGSQEQVMEIRDGYGLYATNLSVLQTEEFCFGDNWTINISSDAKINEFAGWDFIKPLRAPSSFIILSDNYILDNGKGYGYNIYAMLKNILPNNLKSKPLNIALVIKEYDIAKATSIFNKISTFLDSLKLPYKYHLALLLTRINDPHDRNILTNYYWIHSGHSFDYYDDKGTINKKTTLHFHSLVNDNQTIQNLLEGFKLLYAKSISGINRVGQIDVSQF